LLINIESVQQENINSNIQTFNKSNIILFWQQKRTKKTLGGANSNPRTLSGWFYL